MVALSIYILEFFHHNSHMNNSQLKTRIHVQNCNLGYNTSFLEESKFELEIMEDHTAPEQKVIQH